MIFCVSNSVFLKYSRGYCSSNEIVAATAILAPVEEWILLEKLVISSFYHLTFDKSGTDSFGDADIWKNYSVDRLDTAWKQLLFICCGPPAIAYLVKRMIKRNWARITRLAVSADLDDENTDYMVFSQGEMISLLIQWCKISFKNEDLLSCMTELNSKKPIFAPNCAVDMVKKSFAAAVLHSKRYCCQICAYETNHRENYLSHSRIHTGEKPYYCKICSAAFYSRSNLNKHNMLHNRAYNIRCRFCGKQFVKPSYLKVHMVNNHDSESLYQCFSCKLFLKNADDLIAHMPSHDDDLKFQCSQCPRRFAIESRLKEHSLTHSLNKPFKCDICRTGLLRKQDLHRHMAQHSGTTYDCEFCEKKFKRDDHRRSHQRVMHDDTRRN